MPEIPQSPAVDPDRQGGQALVRGKAHGPARRRPKTTETDFVYVTERVQPTDYRILRRAAAVICEAGGKTDHGVVVCRIIGCPVFRMENPINWIPEGALIGIDDDSVSLEPVDPPDPDGDLDGARFSALVDQRRLLIQASVVEADDIAAANKPFDEGQDSLQAHQFFVREELLWAAAGLDPFVFLDQHGEQATAAFLAERLARCLSELRPGRC